jgi:hypothetical protein
MRRLAEILFVIGALLWCLAALNAPQCAADECEDCVPIDTGPQRRDA